MSSLIFADPIICIILRYENAPHLFPVFLRSRLMSLPTNFSATPCSVDTN